MRGMCEVEMVVEEEEEEGEEKEEEKGEEEKETSRKFGGLAFKCPIVSRT